MISLERPLVGFSLDVESQVKYHVTSKTENTHTITALGTASVGDAFLGVERLRIANERAIQNNIKQFITEFSKAGK